MSKLLHYFSSIQPGSWGEDQRGDNTDASCIRVADFRYEKLGFNKPETIRSISSKEKYFVKKGDILIEKSGGGEKTTVGRAIYVGDNYEYVYANFIDRLRPKEKTHGRFLTYFLAHLYSGRINTKYIKQNTGIQNLDLHGYLREEVKLPPVHEWEKIVKFLDYKVEKIDEAIVEKKKLLELLEEKRISFIARQIFGADLEGSKKRSVVEWIGSIPNNWTIEKIKNVSDIVLGKMLLSTEKEGYSFKPYLRAQNITWESVDLTSLNEMWFSPGEMNMYRLKKDDILVSEGGEVGRAAIWANEIEECYIQNSVNRLRAKANRILPKYLLFILECYGKAKVFEGTVNRVSIGHLTKEKLKEYTIPIPPMKEQMTIVDMINQKNIQIENTKVTLQNSINFLKEYKTSLILNFITGRLEV